MCIGIYHRLTKEVVIEQFKRKALGFVKMRQVLVKTWFGEYFWKTMSERDFASVVDDLIVDISGREIHDEDTLADFASHESQVKNCLHLP
jgi:hypothetical protein